ERKNRRLTMPVLAIGGEESGGENAANAMKLVADDVETVVLRGSGHWVAEQAPGGLLAAPTEFPVPYPDRAAAAAAQAPAERRKRNGRRTASTRPLAHRPAATRSQRPRA